MTQEPDHNNCNHSPAQVEYIYLETLVQINIFDVGSFNKGPITIP